jgi:V8-like Glu-specific endopeptidase
MQHFDRRGSVAAVLVTLITVLAASLVPGTSSSPQMAQAQAVTTITPTRPGTTAAPEFWVNRGVSAGGRRPAAATDEDRVSRGQVIGPDDRRQVNPTTGFPWRAVASLEIAFDNGASNVICTGAFIGPTVVLTAGHCLYDPTTTLGFASDVVVVPGKNGSSEPFGYQFAANILVPSGYIQNGTAALDLGLVILPNSQLSSQTGRFRFAGSNGSGLVGMTANLAGYPGEAPTQQWFHAGPIADRSYVASSDTGIVSYPMDTSGGQSGSPVWVFNGVDRVIVGVHTRAAASTSCSNAGGPNNCGTLLTSALAGQLETAGADTRSAPTGPFAAETLPGAGTPPTLTPTRTAAPATPTATVGSGSIGGRGFGVQPALGGVQISWQDGTAETGYLLARLTGPSMVVLPPGGPLPATATSYFDASPPPGLSCYFGAALGSGSGGALGVTDLLCTVPNVRSVFWAPQNLRLQLNQSSLATLSWTAPAGVLYDGYVLAPLGGTPQALPANATTHSVSLTGPTCFVLFVTRFGAVAGNSDVVCGVPGVSTLG